LSDALENHDVATVYNALLKALARNLLYYDTKFGSSFDRAVGDSASWLGFTHGVTFSSAARILCSKYPQLWKPALLQMACFLGRNSRYVDPQLDVAAWSVSDASMFLANSHEGLLDHGVGEPIFSVHLLKTTLAVEAELPYVTPACRQCCSPV
jgi:hypothetical protein